MKVFGLVANEPYIYSLSNAQKGKSNDVLNFLTYNSQGIKLKVIRGMIWQYLQQGE